MKNTVSLKSLAEELNVSISTVSKSLNDSEEISKKTKERVQNLAKLRGYAPNPIAVSLQKQAAMQIGVLLPNIENPFFASVLKGIDTFISNTGYNIITLFSNESLDREKEALKFFARGSVDGVLMCIAEETNEQQNYTHIAELKQRGMPIVLFDRIPQQILGYDTVSVNDVESIQNAFEHLKKQQNQQITFVSSIPNLVVGKRRKEGYVSKAKNPIVITSEDLEKLEKMIQEHLDSNTSDAFIAADINATLLCNSAIQKQGLQFTRHISLIGYVNKPLNELSYPKISFIDQHPTQIGTQTAKMLLQRLESEVQNAPAEDMVIPTTITIGDTCA